MVARGRSVPAVALPSDAGGAGNGSITAVVPSPSSASSAPTNTSATAAAAAAAAAAGAKSNSKLLAQADALARMTIELNLRAVSTQAERLEKDLKALVMCTTQDKEFRDSHERRLQDMWREILVVKKRMGEVQGPDKVDYEKSRRDTSQSIEQLREEMGQLKDLVNEISSTLDRLPTGAEADSQLSIEHTQLSAPETRQNSQADKSLGKYQSRGHRNNNRGITKQRIQDALNSTRRWNRDHKTTGLSDASFTANYLKQQSKRDPRMAVYIQRAIQRHIHRTGRSRSRPRPQSLEQFCQDVTWKDVIETVEEALVTNEDGALKALE